MNQVIKQSADEYFISPGLSNSYLINFDKHPYCASVGGKKTKSMEQGIAIHNFILDNQISIGNASKVLEEIKQKLFEYELTDGLTFGEILQKSQTELSLFWDEKINNELVLRKAKLDLIYESPEQILIIDLKSTRDVFDFAYSIKKYKYYRQAATYIDGAMSLFKKTVIFIFLAFEMISPYYVKAYSISENDIDRGRVANMNSIINWLEWSKNPSLEISGIEKLNIF